LKERGFLISRPESRTILSGKNRVISCPFRRGRRGGRERFFDHGKAPVQHLWSKESLREGKLRQGRKREKGGKWEEVKTPEKKRD